MQQNPVRAGLDGLVQGPESAGATRWRWPASATRFEHDDRPLLDGDVLRRSRLAENVANGLQGLALVCRDVAMLQGVANIELELGDCVWLLERDERAAIADRDQLYALQSLQRFDRRNDDDRVAPVA